MPTFDITSEFNTQEITNAVDQAYREIVNRYDFRDTGTNIEFNEQTITLKSSTEERLKAAEQVLKEKFVKRNVSKQFCSKKNNSDFCKSVCHLFVQGNLPMTSSVCKHCFLRKSVIIQRLFSLD